MSTDPWNENQVPRDKVEAFCAYLRGDLDIYIGDFFSDLDRVRSALKAWEEAR